MVEAATLILRSDTSALKQGERDLDSLARTGARVEGTLTINAKSIERAMARLGTTMGNLDRTMAQVGQAVSQSMGRAAQETQRGARSFDDLRRAIDPAYAASQRFAEVQREVAGMVESGAASQRAANIVLEQAASRYMGVATAAERAEQAQREQAQAVAMATGNYQALRAAIDPVYASSKRYEQALETANAALKAKIITEQEHARVMQLAQTRYLGLGGAADDAGKGVAKFAPQLTNASFQIQDFAVQVASGQSALMAFTQQFPQLAGALGASGKLALLGAGLGTLVAVGMAVAPMFLDIGKKAQTAEDAVSELTDVLSAYQSASENARRTTAELSSEFGVNAQQAQRLYEVMASLAQLDFAKKASDAANAITRDFTGINQSLDEINARMQGGLGNIDRFVERLNNKYGITLETATGLQSAISQINLARASGDADRLATAFAEFSDYVAEANLRGEKLPVWANEAAIRSGEAALAMLQMAGSTDAAVAATDNWAAAMAGVRAEILGIASALSQIGGGMISNAAKFVEINALKAGKSVAQARVEVEKFNVEANYNGRIMAAEARGGALGWIEAQALRAAKSMELSGIAADTEADALRKNAVEAERAASKKSRGTSDAEKASKKAARESERLAERLDKEAEKWGELLSPVTKYKNAMRDLEALRGRLSEDQMAEAQKRLNVELADSIPLAGEFVDTMTEGLLNGFNGTLDSMESMLKRWLANAMAMAAKNRIVIAMGMGGLGGIGGGDALTSALGAAGAPVGGVGGVLGGIGAFGGAALTGASGFLTAAAGGFGSAATYTGFMLKGATSSLAGFGSALGAVALPLAAVALAFSFFSKKTKELDRGMQVTVTGFETMVETFRKTETKRFWGLSKKTRTSYEAADQETQDALSRVVGELQEGVMKAAEVLGFGAETFAGFAHVMKISTKGMSEEEAMKAVQEAIAGLGDDFAGMVPGLQRLTRDGETTSEALARLSQSLVGVNGIMDTLGHRFRAAGLAGAEAASLIAEAFGGLDAMAAATQRYYQAFYSDAERLAVTTRQTSAALAELGIAMPETRREYRAMIASLNLTTESGREAYAALIGLSEAFDLILPQIAGFTREMEAMQDRVVTSIGRVIDGLSEAIRLNTSAAADWRKAGDGIRDYLDKLRGTASALFSPQQARAYNQALYQRTLQQANSGDLEAAGRLPGAADTYLSSVMDTAKTREEAALAQARVAAALGNVATRAETTAEALDRVAALQQRQVDILTGVQEHLAAGNSLTEAGITRLLGQLGGLDDRIALRAGDAGTIVAGVTGALNTANITASITGADGLRTALVDLREAIAAETARTRRQAAVARLNSYVGNLTANAAGKHFVDDADLTAMSRIAGINTTGLNTNQIRNRLAAFDGGDLLRGTVYDPTGSQERAYVEKERLKQEVAGMYGTIRQMMTQYGVTTANPFVLNNKGVRSNPHTGHFFINGRHITDHSHPFWNTLWGSGGLWARFTAAETALKNVPGFALGGSHVGGLRIVGENGPELEATGASRIYSNSQTRSMLDNREVVAELRQVVRRLEAVEAFTRKTAESVTSTDKTLKRVDALGVKIDPDQNLVSGTTPATTEPEPDPVGGAGEPIYDVS